LEGKPKPEAPGVERRFEIALEHARMAESYEADPRGAAIEFRKHLGWYVKGVANSAELRRKLHAVTSLSEVEDVFAEYLADPHRGANRTTLAGEGDVDREAEATPAAA
jgi:tRNA-dihydrouridine synthase